VHIADILGIHVPSIDPEDRGSRITINSDKHYKVIFLAVHFVNPNQCRTELKIRNFSDLIEKCMINLYT
jgi:hypothetical protein